MGGLRLTDLVAAQGILVIPIHRLMEIEDKVGPIGDEKPPLVVDLLVLQFTEFTGWVGGWVG